MKRSLLAILIGAALLSLAASEGSAPWRHVRVFGWEIMSKEERATFRDEMRTYPGYKDQLAFWRRHVVKIQKRAWDKGLFLDEPPEIMSAKSRQGYRRVIFASYLMTGAEIEAYRAKELEVGSEQEYEEFRRQHEIAMQAKARAKGLPIDLTPTERKQRKKDREEAKMAAKLHLRKLNFKRLNLQGLNLKGVEPKSVELKIEATSPR